MNFLIDPNISYVLLVIGLVLSMLALFSPGTGIIEIGALFTLVLAGIGIWNMPINWWALVILVAGVIPFILALRKSRHWIWLLISILSLVLGSVFVFKKEGDGLAVHPVLAIVTSIIAVVFLWFVGRKSIEAMGLKPCLLYTSPAHETPEHLVCRLLLEKKKKHFRPPSCTLSYFHSRPVLHLLTFTLTSYLLSAHIPCNHSIL